MHIFVAILLVVLYVSLSAAQVYPTMGQTGHPWFLSDNVGIGIQNDTNIVDIYSLGDDIYILAGKTSSRSLSICRYSRTSKWLRRVHLNISDVDFPGFDPFRRNADIAFVVDPISGNAHIAYTFADKIGIQTYSAIASQFQTSDMNLNLSLEYTHSLPSSRTSVNPKIVCSLWNGTLLIGIYQHSNDNVTGLHAWYTAEYQGPPFNGATNWFYSSERAYSITISADSFRVQNATHIFYLRATGNGLAMSDAREASTSKTNLIKSYSVSAKDTNDNSTYYLNQEPVDWNEAWGETRLLTLHHLDSNDSFIRSMALVPYVPGTVPYFFMDLKVTGDFIYCIFVSIQPLIFSRFMRLEKRYGGREIVVIKINKSKFNYVAHTGVSTIGDDNGHKLLLEADESLYILGTTNADMANPLSAQYIASNLTTIFVSRFQSFEISSFIVPLSLSNASGIRVQEYKNFSVLFTQDIKRIRDSPWVYFQRRQDWWAEVPSLVDSMSNLIITAPKGGGNDMELVVAFWSHPHLPMLFNYSLSYDPPYIASVTPLHGPTTGGTMLQFRCLNIADFDYFPNVEVKIGGRACTSQLHAGDYFICLAPSGTGTEKSIVVSFLGNQGKANVTFSYDPPIISSVQPNFTSPSGGSEIAIIGNNFGSAIDPTVYLTIDGRNCSLQSITHNKITCRAPAGIGQSLDVFVSINGQNITSAGIFHYFPPEILTIYPTASRDSTGFVVIQGRNFGNDSSKLRIMFVATNSTVHYPCSNITSIGPAFSDILNCTLDGSLPAPDKYNIHVSVIGGETSLETHLFETGSVNQPPVAIPQHLTLLEDSRLIFRLKGIELDLNDTLQFYIKTLPNYGQLYKADTDLTPFVLDEIFGSALVPGNLSEVYYVPNLDFSGQDVLQIEVCDPYFCGSSANITLDIIPVNDPPIVRDLSMTLDEDTMVTLMLNSSDVDSTAGDVRIIVLTLPSGTLSDSSVPIVSIPHVLSDKTVKYTPLVNRHGQPPSYYYSNFSFVAYDGINYSTTPGAVKFNVRPIDDLPVAKNLVLEMDRNQNLPVNLECADIDTASWNLILNVTKLPHNGTIHSHDSVTNAPGNPLLGVVENEKGRIWFIPSRDFIGKTEFLYECLDDTGAKSNSATVTISVNPVIDCVEEIMFSSEFVNGVVSLYPIDLSSRLIGNLERIQFMIVKYPPRGIISSSDGVIIREGELIATSRVWFSSNNTGGADPYGNFTYIAIGPSNTSSASCNTRFKAVCSQSYLNVFNNNSGNICEPCASGAVCSVNGFFTPYAVRGFWKSPEDAIYLPCFPESACPGDANQICSTGRTGIRCASCESGYYKFQDRCIQCTTPPTTLMTLIFVAIIVGGLLLVIASDIYSNGPSLGLLSITINFIQTILIVRNFQLKWPIELVQILDYLSFIKLNIDYSSPECLVAYEAINFNYSFKMKISLLVPFILLIALGVCMGVWRIILKLYHLVWRNPSSSVSSKKGILIPFIKNFNMLLSIVFISLAQNSLALFDCSLEVDRNYYLDADLSLKCFEKWWWADFPLAVVAVMIYVVGIPFYFFMLYFCSHQNYYRNSVWLRMKSFTQQVLKSDKLFHPQFQYFTFIQFIQKLLLAIIDMFFTRYVMVQSVLLLYILIFMSFIYYKHRPYACATLNTLDILSMIMSLFVVTLGQVFRSEALRTDAQRLGLTILIFFIIFGFLFIALLCGLYEFHRKVRAWVMESQFSRVRGSGKKV